MTYPYKYNDMLYIINSDMLCINDVGFVSFTCLIAQASLAPHSPCDKNKFHIDARFYSISSHY